MNGKQSKAKVVQTDFSEYVARTSLYLDRLKIFEWMKFLRRHLHQIQGN